MKWLGILQLKALSLFIHADLIWRWNSSPCPRKLPLQDWEQKSNVSLSRKEKWSKFNVGNFHAVIHVQKSFRCLLKIQVLPTGVDPMTFRLLVRMLFGCAVGDSWELGHLVRLLSGELGFSFSIIISPF